MAEQLYQALMKAEWKQVADDRLHLQGHEADSYARDEILTALRNSGGLGDEGVRINRNDVDRTFVDKAATIVIRNTKIIDAMRDAGFNIVDARGKNPGPARG